MPSTFTETRTDRQPNFSKASFGGVRAPIGYDPATGILDAYQIDLSGYATQTALAFEATVRANDDTTLQNNINTREPAITAGAAAQYWRGDKSWVTLNAAAVAGLGDAATKNVGTTLGSVATGDHLHDGRYPLLSHVHDRIVSGSYGVTVGGGGNIRVGLLSGSILAQLHIYNSTPTQPVQILQGAAGQTAPLQKFQLISSTGATRDAGTLNFTWQVDTDSVRRSEAALQLAATGGALFNAFEVLYGGTFNFSNNSTKIQLFAGGVVNYIASTGISRQMLKHDDTTGTTIVGGGNQSSVELRAHTTEVFRGNNSNQIGFMGAAPVARQTLPAAAVDAATTQALANSTRAALINLGLAQ